MGWAITWCPITYLGTRGRLLRLALVVYGLAPRSASCGETPGAEGSSDHPDVILQPHNASLQITFYQEARFPDEYRGDLFANEHGSWNKATRTGYEVIRIPRHHAARRAANMRFSHGIRITRRKSMGPSGRVAVAPDGSLLVTDDGSNSIWRVDYTGAGR